MRNKTIQLTPTVSGMILGGILSLPFLVYADTATNLVVNPGLETRDPSDAKIPEHWSQGFWGTNDTLFTYPAPGADGTKAAKVEITNYTDGDAKWFFGDISVHPEEQYIFSDYYVTNISSDVIARYTLLDGKYRYAYLGTPVISATWTGYATLPFTVPKNAASLTVFHLIHETGSLAIDNVSLRRIETTKKQTEVVSVPTPLSENAGTVPLSYIAPRIADTVQVPLIMPEGSQTTITENAPKKSTIIDTVFTKINNPGTLTYARHPKEEKGVNENDSPASFVHSAEAAAETPSNFLQKTNGAAPLGTLARDFSDFSLAFFGLLLIAFSIGLTLLLGYQSSKSE